MREFPFGWRFEVRTNRGGSAVVNGLCLTGSFGCHEMDGLWHLTHFDTGLRLSSHRSPEKCLEVARRIEARHGGALATTSASELAATISRRSLR